VERTFAGFVGQSRQRDALVRTLLNVPANARDQIGVPALAAAARPEAGRFGFGRVVEKQHLFGSRTA
jgi:hypothetical protein